MASKWLKLFPDAERTKARFLIDGEDAYEAMLKAMDTATGPGHYIYILGWMLDIDVQLVASDLDSSLYKKLKRAAEGGVAIRILIWDNIILDYAKMASDAIPRLNRLKNTKVFIDEHTYFPPQSKALLQKITPSLKQALQYLGRQFTPQALQDREQPFSYYIYRLLGIINFQIIGAHHEKVTLVKGRDGLIGFCGGIDYNHNRVYSDQSDQYRIPYYHDTACRLQGPAAYEILQKFKLRWANHPVASRETPLGADEPKPKPSPAPYPYCKIVGTYNSPNGEQKIRTLKKAYLDIIDAAEKYIYIEDQYLVNLDVAKHINARLKLSTFDRAIFVIQDSGETKDIFIPNRKRGEFLEAVTDGLSADDKAKKVLLALIDKTYWKQLEFHQGMHAKTLIVDDEIAIIGSANVNQRSFTNDSETSVVVFDDNVKNTNNFARVFRIVTWKELLQDRMSRASYESWVKFADEMNAGHVSFAKIAKYETDSQPDLDVEIQEKIKASSVLGPYAVTYVFDTLWANLIDPNADFVPPPEQ